MRLKSGMEELDAEFSIDPISDQGGSFSVVLESRGGGRNPHYSETLEALLRAVGIVRAEITSIEVVSPRARALPPSERRLPLR